VRSQALRALRASLDAGGFLAVVVVGVAVVLVLRLLRARGGRAGSAAATLIAVVALGVSLAGIAELTLFGARGSGAEQRLELDPDRRCVGLVGHRLATRHRQRHPVRPARCRARGRVVPDAAGRAARCAALVSVGVEVFQWAFPTGRIANSADVLANTAGAALGITLARLLGACVGARR
jgi:hypothetical protein